jgi:hypothetical protein
MRITSKPVHDVNKMEDNFALCFVFTYHGIITCAELNWYPRPGLMHGTALRAVGSGIIFTKIYLSIKS